MAGDVDGHAELEEQHPPWVEVAETRHQTHGGAAVRQHVQHRAELGTCYHGSDKNT